MSNEIWEEMVASLSVLSLSVAQQRSQLCLVHRVYRTQKVLWKMGLKGDAECPLCWEEMADESQAQVLVRHLFGLLVER